MDEGQISTGGNVAAIMVPKGAAATLTLNGVICECPILAEVGGTLNLKLGQYGSSEIKYTGSIQILEGGKVVLEDPYKIWKGATSGSGNLKNKLVPNQPNRAFALATASGIIRSPESRRAISIYAPPFHTAYSRSVLKFFHDKVGIALCRHLRKMGYCQNLHIASHIANHTPHSIGGAARNTGVNFIENHCGHACKAGHLGFETQHYAGNLTAAGAFGHIYGIFPVAEKAKSTESAPVGPPSTAITCTSNTARSSSRNFRLDNMASANQGLSPSGNH